MDFAFDEALVAWRLEIQQFLESHVTDTLRRELATYGVDEPSLELIAFRRALGDRGWRSLDWPEEYGGLGRSRVELEILIQELEYAGAAEDDVTVTSIAPAILRHGTEENKADWLPGIRSGDISVALGYSEPDAGTDLASLRTKAVLDGSEWVIDGSKMWNSGAHVASHEWLCVRTDLQAPPRRGLSVVMVPLDLPGIEVQPIYTWGDIRTNVVYFDGVRVPAGNLIGEVNRGWQYITGALHLERAAIAGVGHLRRTLDELYALCTTDDGASQAPPISQPWVARAIAQLWTEFGVIELMSWDVASRIDAGKVPVVEATELKILSSEFRQELADVGAQLLGPMGQLRTSDGRAPLGGAIERLYREAPLLRFGGGANEVLRDVVAQVAHGLPSSRAR